ncbi:MAG: hypothetical protein C0404_11630 [Verrucomicrobia bacterium]|nr:hypothetical protein [Verrucomicrobiota bacterium]
MGRKKIIAGVLAVVILAGAGAAIDRLLSRPDRIGLEMEKERLHDLHDAILRFNLDRERFPESLSELVPGYVPASLMFFHPEGSNNPARAIAWDSGAGTLSWSVPLKIRGIFARTVNTTLSVPRLAVLRDPLKGANAFRQPRDPVALRPEDIVVEAELFQSLSYGWEIEESESASGECYIHLKEGAGDVNDDKMEFDPKVRSGDFYNITRNNARLEARCYFEAPADGEYLLAVRTRAERSRCSNMIKVQVDDREFTVGHNGSEPFVWLWHAPGSMFLAKGHHSLGFHTFQDGVCVDQAILTRTRPDLSGNRIFSGGHPQSAVRPDKIQPLTLSLSVDTLSITNAKAPNVIIYVRNNGQLQRHAKLQVCLDLPGHRTRERTYEIDLPADTPLVRFPCEIDLPPPLEKKEYLLRCRIVEGSAVIQERTLVLYSGYDWSVLGPLPFMATGEEGEPENARELAPSYSFAGRTNAWQKYSEGFSDHFGVMDFGRMFCDRTYEATPSVSLYAYTEIEAARSGDYLLKAAGDDNIVVWINGTKVATIAHKKETVIRSAAEFKVQLNEGRNRILFRLNQIDGQWQACIRFRTADDKVADITGVPFSQQSARLHAPPLRP